MRSYGVTNVAPYATAPPVGAAGDEYWNTTSGILYISNGIAWIPVSVPGINPRPNQVLTGGAGFLGWQYPQALIYVTQINAYSVGQFVRYQNSGSQPVLLAQADSSVNAEVAGMIVWIGSDEFQIQTSGYVGGLSGLTPGTVYFLHPTTPGALTAIEPTTPGQVSKPVLIAVTATTGILLSMRGIVISSSNISLELLKGIKTSGTSVSAPATGALLPQTAANEGIASWLTASYVTIGTSGLYLIQANVQYVSPTVLAVGFAVRSSAGVDYTPPMFMQGMTSAGNPAVNTHGSWIRTCTAGETFAVFNSGNPITGGSAFVRNFSMVKIADGLATS